MNADQLFENFEQLEQTEKEKFMTLVVKPKDPWAPYHTWDEVMGEFESNTITSAEAAELVGISLPTLRRWVKAGKITPAKTLGRNHLFDTRAVLDLSEAVRRLKGEQTKP